MTLREFIIRFKGACHDAGINSDSVWHYLPADELQWLANGEEWEWFQYCLTRWKDKELDRCHDTPMPDTSCNGCKYKTKKDYCKIHKKQIPKTFNRANACKEWEL